VRPGWWMRPSPASWKVTLPEVMRSGSKVWASAMLTLPLALSLKTPPRGLVLPSTCTLPEARRSVSCPVTWRASSATAPLARLRRMGSAERSSMPSSLRSKLSNCADRAGSEQSDGVADIEAGEGEMGLGLVVAEQRGLPGGGELRADEAGLQIVVQRGAGAVRVEGELAERAAIHRGVGQ